MKKPILISLVTGFITLFLVAGLRPGAVSIHAQTPSPSPEPLLPPEPPSAGINLTLSPVFINLATNPGEPVSSQIKITNNNNFTEFLQLDLAKFEAAAGGERPQLLDIDPSNPEDEFVNWISFSEDQFTVDPLQTKTIRFTISPPSEAALGYYYATIVNRIQEREPGARQTVVTGAPAVLTLLEVRSPQAKRELQLLDFKTDRLFYEYLPVEFQIKLKNTGNIHIVPAGDVFIDWGSRKDVAVLLANEKRSNILPQSERILTASWDDGFAVRVPKIKDDKIVTDDQGRTVYETRYDLTKAHKFRIGKYTAHLLMVYDSGERDIPLEAAVSFWVVPWKILGILTVVILLALIGLKNTIITNVRRVKSWLS